MAVLANVGTLLQPTTRPTTQQAVIARPTVSHSDQQNEWADGRLRPGEPHRLGRQARRSNDRRNGATAFRDHFDGGHHAVHDRQQQEPAAIPTLRQLRTAGLRDGNAAKNARLAATSNCSTSTKGNLFVDSAKRIASTAIDLSVR